MVEELPAFPYDRVQLLNEYARSDAFIVVIPITFLHPTPNPDEPDASKAFLISFCGFFSPSVKITGICKSSNRSRVTGGKYAWFGSDFGDSYLTTFPSTVRGRLGFTRQYPLMCLNGIIAREQYPSPGVSSSVGEQFRSDRIPNRNHNDRSADRTGPTYGDHRDAQEGGSWLP